ncbi:sensor histidine kinase [Halalkalibacter okhensis]|uniref:histidine kinase n=1 Tax=Halalkalibacter okhensis TaxID=333138 RepID=A0A0B0IGK3_9BACI|nr:HAMP domain-containing sensor histidine kinase [Halalkalibacter okhensis]KHF41728.1 hypothetical protein LQ50_00005 [Halalkalibacter okhensis]
MDTKWKNRALVLGWLVLFTFGISGVIAGWTYGIEFSTKDFFQSDEFEYQFEDFVNQLSVYELNQMTKEEVKEAIIITEDEIEEHRYRYGDLSDQIATIKVQYEDLIQEALQAENQEAADAYQAKRDQKIEDITDNFMSDEHIRAKILKEKEARIDEYFIKLEQTRSNFSQLKGGFHYYFEDTETDEVFTNVSVKSDEVNDFFASNKMLYVQSYPSKTSGYFQAGVDQFEAIYYDELVTPVLQTRTRVFEGKIAIPHSTAGASPILTSYSDYQQRKWGYIIYTFVGVILLIASFFLNKRLNIMKRLHLRRFESYYLVIPIDGKAFLFMISLYIVLHNINQLVHSPYYLFNVEHVSRFYENFFLSLLTATLFMGLVFIQGKYFMELLKDKSVMKQEGQKALVYKAYQTMIEAFSHTRVGLQVMIYSGVVFLFGVGAVISLFDPIIFFLYSMFVFIVGLPVFTILMKRIGYFNRIAASARHVVIGQLEEDIPVKGKSILATLARDINTLKQGMKRSQNEQAKSERLKTELITNVSHDLRTPLTSIITYTELLKANDVKKEDQNAYIQIIDRKSKRLKVLIDDLFEASKMASGNIELMKEKVDIVQLLQQALAEYNEEIDGSTLQFRVSTPEQPVSVVVDGQKIWRVFDNIIVNTLHYSLENTRVYIAIKTEGDSIIISFKNITKYELGENIDELMERFKRGDTSRHTEGSGLGLAIAKSIVDLHGGNLDIEVDGDLFKVMVTLYQ